MIIRDPHIFDVLREWKFRAITTMIKNKPCAKHTVIVQQILPLETNITIILNFDRNVRYFFELHELLRDVLFVPIFDHFGNDTFFSYGVNSISKCKLYSTFGIRDYL